MLDAIILFTNIDIKGTYAIDKSAFSVIEGAKETFFKPLNYRSENEIWLHELNFLRNITFDMDKNEV